MWSPEKLDEVQLPIDMQSKNTMVNVTQNKAAIDYCERPGPPTRRRGCPSSFANLKLTFLSGCETFDYMDNRIKCIESLTGAMSMDRRGRARCLSCCTLRGPGRVILFPTVTLCICRRPFSWQAKGEPDGRCSVPGVKKSG